MFIDSHTHLSQIPDEEREKQIQTAKGLGTDTFIEVATTAKNAADVIEFTEARDDTFCGMAVHPWQVHTYSPTDVDLFRQIIKERDKVVCIGECGLDYSQADAQTAEKQRDLFRDMIRLAREVNLPLNMHSDRISFQDLLTILREEKAYEVGGMMHNYQGNLESAKQYLDMGFYVSVCILVHHPLAHRLRGTYHDISIGQMVMDSDAPGAKLVRMGEGEEPYPHDMDKYSEPRMLRYIADKLAEVKEMPLEELGAITSLNTSRLFNLPRV